MAHDRESSTLLEDRMMSSARDENPFSRAFETASHAVGGGYTEIPERNGEGWPAPEGPDWKPGGLHSYHAQPPSTLKGSGLAAASPGRDRRKPRTKTKFPSLTPAPGAYRVSGDTKAAEAVAHARKTWAPPALRTQAISSYGAVPDLEIIPERVEVKGLSASQQGRRDPDLGCPSCTIS